MAKLEEINSGRLMSLQGDFVELLADAVESGASVGFLPPITAGQALNYWIGVGEALRSGDRVLIGAFEEGRLAGSVQLALAAMPNGLHRAEVMKLMVLRSIRRRGIGRALMEAVEEVGRRFGRSLLVLDTRMGDASENLYRSLGYITAGIIPGYASSADRSLHDTVIFYKQI